MKKVKLTWLFVAAHALYFGAKLAAAGIIPDLMAPDKAKTSAVMFPLVLKVDAPAMIATGLLGEMFQNAMANSPALFLVLFFILASFQWYFLGWMSGFLVGKLKKSA